MLDGLAAWAKSISAAGEQEGRRRPRPTQNVEPPRAAPCPHGSFRLGKIFPRSEKPAETCASARPRIPQDVEFPALRLPSGGIGLALERRYPVPRALRGAGSLPEMETQYGCQQFHEFDVSDVPSTAATAEAGRPAPGHRAAPRASSSPPCGRRRRNVPVSADDGRGRRNFVLDERLHTDQLERHDDHRPEHRCVQSARSARVGHASI